MGVYLLDLACATFTYFGGYEPLTDVTAHSKIDLDLINIMDNLGGTRGSSCTLKDCDPPTSVAAEGTGCNYDGVTVEFPSGDTFTEASILSIFFFAVTVNCFFELSNSNVDFTP